MISTPRPTYTKRVPEPVGYVEWEAAGLRWLAEPAAVRVAEVIRVGEGVLVLESVRSTQPSPDAARELGRGLARLHAAGAPAWGAGPTGWEGDGWLGPSSEPLPLLLRPTPSWGAFYAGQRLLPLVEAGRDRGVLEADEVSALERLAARVEDGGLDTADTPARIHGDLWAGNILWSAQGAVLVDPAAHGGHREADLAMLALFGVPHLEDVLAGYQEEQPLHDGWQERTPLHQVHPLLLHTVLFGRGYAERLRAAVAACP